MWGFRLIHCTEKMVNNRVHCVFLNLNMNLIWLPAVNSDTVWTEIEWYNSLERLAR